MPPRRRRLGGEPPGREGGAPQAQGSAPTMSAPAPSPPAGAAPPPLPPPPSSPPEPVLLFCYECGNAVDVTGTPLPIPPTSPLRVCSCCRGYLDEHPPPPPEPVPYYCPECGSTINLHNPPLRVVCPTCYRGLLVESPPPPPFLGSSSSSSDYSDDDIDLLSTDYDAARAFISRFVHQGPDEGPIIGNFAAAAAMSALRDNPNRPAIGAAFNTILQRQLGFPPAPSASGGGEPPASAATIAALPTVEVAEPAAACAICKDDLPLASQATKLPCAHLYHSSCIVTWLEMHNSCPVCRFRIPSAAAAEDQESATTRVTIRFSTNTRRRRGVRGGAGVSAPISASPTQLAQAVTGSAAGGPANSGETVSSEWPQHSESDAVMSEAREGDEGFFD